MTATVTSTPPRRGQSIFWRRFRRSTPGKVGAIIVALFVLLALLAPVLRPYDPTTDRNYRLNLKPPSITALWDAGAKETYTDPATGKVNLWAAPFGTDNLGRDIYARVLHGTRISLKVGVVSTLLALVIGTLLGVMAGFFGGWFDSVMGYLTDVLLAFPSILLAIGFATIFSSDHPPLLIKGLDRLFALNSPQLVTAMLAVSLVQIPVYMRLARSVVLSIREREFVQAAGALGASQWRMVFKHVLPNSLSPLIVQGALSIATATIEVAALGFLGIGAQPPLPEWGTMISDSRQYYVDAPWTMIFPGLAIFLTVLGFNLLGDGLRDVLDPRSTQ
ncbi:ABC transporter permease [Deinococcus radiodurans]|jgi:ABC-type dipeptide/oligopeptide/nickel transport systems, permease components|uniref:Peptide ABC transporter, permease protein n=1 Tax=Deinococcus radiodurans (strain ATCC 13939 / DSM 20539 / JCM 16871 / CCUG 27074 / LMG 4051 / NBRC 15346 / NCIMB 9279 / VKM B-1422 / R1) TaxID=243230 RepID=Q9RVR4_DEIRA|nr:ABC transporter permease [Deinococcus radiodurans]AAF10533.1 peptide ABC transporter, permease protein [Deinococcus radiodurans R1 = ATCC 13939 = DSM 20539]ANC71849.1 peptide ABC transporter permease [Deinococcus radiodurans R1 = ATCC 13939 = DSM 20539]QEM70451.1 ABC transporter permease [Deinococcus radiodurans]QIP29066.1 ABC transporter permease [Deinococcus radiodurans]QIP32229.1 ABC transporter permease [Deinococcus radiodurans]